MPSPRHRTPDSQWPPETVWRFAAATLDAAVDLTDHEQVERFVQRYNDGLAA